MRLKHFTLGLFLLSSLLLAMFATWVYSQLENSLPVLEGNKAIYGLSDKVSIERDHQGIATISASNRKDLAVATGFVHAQERFFQMDLLRRNSAGELSSLFGDVAVSLDKKRRLHDFRKRAREIVKQLPKSEYKILHAYTRGVNEGLKALVSPPFEYLLLQQAPVDWREEDSVLVVLSMYLDLQYSKGERELTLGILNDTLSNDVFQFLNPKGSLWDAAIDGTHYKPSKLPSLPWPTADNSFIAKDNHHPLIAKSNPSNNVQEPMDTEQFPGSNNWAVNGQISSTSSAIVANDMHLGLSVPNTWFRASFNYQEKASTGETKKISITGLTLPGTPMMVIGSNGNIAWGFTNSYGDWSDVIVLETNEDNSQYLTPDGYKAFTEKKHIIAVKDQSPVNYFTKETIWGPVIPHKNKLLAYRWVAHDIEAVNLRSMSLEQAQTVEQAFVIAAQSGIPAQNLMVGDKAGNIGWTIMGAIPKRSTAFGDTPQSWANGQYAWQGYLAPQNYPKVLNPDEHRLWTANSRVVGNDFIKIIGNGGYALGARSKQIKQRLFEKEHFNEQDLLAIALDDEALFLKRWQQFILEQVLNDALLADKPQWQKAKTLLENKTKLAATVDSVAYRIVRNFRLNLRDHVFSLFNENLKKTDDSYSFSTIRHQIETPLWQLINQQPDNFLWLPNDNWRSVFIEVMDKTLASMSQNQTLEQATWGQQNTSQIKHPLSRGVPIIGRWLDMPEIPLPGDSYVPRVQGKAFGASQRMVVSPGHEATGIMQMPTSQSGHPWSPYYRVGHQDWAEGKVSPFLPGPTKYKLTLTN